MDLKSLLILKGFFILTLYFNPVVEGDIPFGLCANPECSEPVGVGITMLKYASPDDSRISVAANEEVAIFVKDFGPKKDLLGIMVRGNKGYISKSFIRETKSFTKQLVPAQVEFRSVVLLTEGYSVTSHLHVSSHHHSGTPISSSESILHSHTYQQQFVNLAPSNLLQMHYNPTENLQASHSVLLSSHDPSQLHNVPEYSSHFDGRNTFASSHVTDVRFESNVMPSQSPVAGVRDPSFHNDPSLFSHYPEGGINSMHNFDPTSSLHLSQGAALDPNTVYPSHPQQSFSQYPSQQMHQEHTIFASEMNINEHPSSMQLQQQQFPSQHSPEMHMNQRISSMQFQQHQIPPQHSPEMHMNQHPSSIQFQQQQYPSQHSPEMLMNQHTSSIQMQQQQHQSQISPEMNFNQDPSSIQIQQQQHQSQISPEMNFNQDPSSIQMQQQQHQSQISPEMNFNQDPSSIQMQQQYYQSQVMPEAHIIEQQQREQQQMQSQHMSQIHPNPQLSSIQQQQQVQSQHLSEMQSAMHSPDYFEPMSDADYERTLAMLSDRGIDHNYLYSDSSSESQSFHTAPNVQPDIGASQVEVNTVSGQSQYSTMHTNEAVLQSSLNPNLNDESRIINSQVSEESIAKPPENSDMKTGSLIADKTPVDVDLVEGNEESEAEILAESEEETDEEEEVEDNVINDISVSTSEKNTVVEKEDISDLESEANEKENVLNEKKASLNEALSENTDASSDIKNFIDPTIAHEKNYFGSEGASSDVNKNNDFQTKSVEDHIPPISDFFMENELNSDLNKIVNTVGIDKVGDSIRSIYQNRNLKGEDTTEEQQLNSENISEENDKDADSSYFNSFQNGLLGLKSFIDSILSWVPEPLYSLIMDLQNKGISPRVPVFTTLFGIVCILLIVPLFYIKESSKESKLISQLASVEKKAYTLSATNNALEEKLESVQTELNNLQVSLKKEKAKCEDLTIQYENQKADLELTKSELETCLEEIEVLKEKENELMTIVQDHSRKMDDLLEHKNSLDKIITDQENSIESLTNQLQEREEDLKKLEDEKSKLIQLKNDYEDKIALFDKNCNQLLQEAEVWNLRVNELTMEVNEEKSLKTELEASLKEKDEEIESLKNLVETFESFDAIEDSEDELKTKEEKLQCLINSSKVLNQLKKEEDKSKVLEDQLGTEKNKILDMEVELLDAKSEIDKLKLSYNQALQDKAEAQTKLDVLTNYFKDKEIQLQRQLGAQEAEKQKKTEDANSAERRICLIDQENASYKFQVASMKQEMEETERNLKSQIAAQEKKAHENWIAARAAERKLEDMKQEVTQLRQRLTLLEREQENWNNSMRDDIIRPVPKRIPGASEESGNQDLNISERGMFPRPPLLHDPLPPLPPMMLPPDRPLPPLPPPMPPMFLPPMERHFRPQPWQPLPPDPNSDYRTTPPDFVGGRESTPPRGRQSMHTDGDAGPHTSSPLTTDLRDSRNSTPPHLLPDFHDIPPQPGRPFFPPPPHLAHPRLPMHPPFRRDPPPPKRLDNSNEYSSRGSQQSSSQEQWQHSRV